MPDQQGSERPPAAEPEGTPDSAIEPPDATADRPPASTTAPRLPTTKTSAAFKSLLAGAIVLVLLLVFILENTQSVAISYFGATGHLALGVALLLAAVGGALLVGIVGSARIAQLRRHAKRRR